MNKKFIILITLGSSLAAALFATALIPALRDSVRNYLSTPEHEILAAAEGDVLNNGSLCKVIKYRNGEGIYVEVLKMKDGGGDTTVVDRILLRDKHDGLFNYQGHVTRLAIADIDNDGKLELLAPTFDDQLVPHLNVFHYNGATSRFELYQPGAK